MAKKAKKRGVKPGTKRGPYKKPNKIIKGLQQAVEFTKLPKSVGNSRTKEFTVTAVEGSQIKLGDIVTMGNLPSLISDLTSTIDTLEAQLTAQIDRIKSILN